MKAADASVKSVYSHQSTRRHMPESDLKAVRKSRAIYPKSDFFFWKGRQLRPPTALHSYAKSRRHRLAT